MIDTYRVRRPRSWTKLMVWIGRHYRDSRPPRPVIVAVRAAAYATPHRTWQAEWEGCRCAPRAFTRRGVYRKAVAALGG